MLDLNTLQDANDNLKKEQFSVLLIWTEGCHVCETAKPEFDKLESDFSDNFTFYKWKLDQESYNFYSQYEEKHEVWVDVLDEDGDPIQDFKGNNLKKLLKDDDGNVVKRANISVPKYYVFHGSEASEENPYGLLGKVEGHNLEQLRAILGQISQMAQEEQNEQA